MERAELELLTRKELLELAGGKLNPQLRKELIIDAILGALHAKPVSVESDGSEKGSAEVLPFSPEAESSGSDGAGIVIGILARESDDAGAIAEGAAVDESALLSVQQPQTLAQIMKPKGLNPVFVESVMEDAHRQLIQHASQTLAIGIAQALADHFDAGIVKADDTSVTLHKNGIEASSNITQGIEAAIRGFRQMGF